MYIGRFAPTPSGPLHMGSLVTALASYCEAKSHDGKWLVRMEDLDTPRVVKGAADNILATLEAFGFEWDDDILYQSQRFDAYQEVIQRWIDERILFACDCSRKSLARQNLHYGPLGMIYPGHCRLKNLDMHQDYSLRLNLQQAGTISFSDKLYGNLELDLSNQVGDIVIKRIDGIYAYHLAVVVDDAYQQVSHIVRGADLLEVTALHIYLNRLLKFNDAGYMHLPLIKNPDGKKLSKQTGARAIDVTQASSQIISALEFLGQKPDKKLAHETPKEILKVALAHWDPSRIPADSESVISPG